MLRINIQPGILHLVMNPLRGWRRITATGACSFRRHRCLAIAASNRAHVQRGPMKFYQIAAIATICTFSSFGVAQTGTQQTPTPTTSGSTTQTIPGTPGQTTAPGTMNTTPGAMTSPSTTGTMQNGNQGFGTSQYGTNGSAMSSGTSRTSRRNRRSHRSTQGTSASGMNGTTGTNGMSNSGTTSPSSSTQPQ